MRKILGFVSCLLSLPVLGQVSDYYPQQFSVFFYNYNLVNPAYVPEEGEWDVAAGYGNRTGPFRKVAHYYVSGDRIVTRKESSRVYRLVVQNEKEGPYILRPKALFNYAYQIPLKKDHFLAAGISAGLASFSFTAPTATASGTAFLPDGAAGLTFRSRRLFTGFSVMQMFNATSAPINANIRLARYYNPFLSVENDLSPFWKIKASLLYRIQPGFRNEFDAALHFIHNQSLNFGTMLRVKRGLTFFAAFEVPVGEEKLFLGFSYNSPAFSPLPEFQSSIELTSRLRLY